jgi:arginase
LLTLIRVPGYTILEAPSNLGLWESGVERLPDALRSAGLPSMLGADSAGRVDPLPYDSRRDPETQLLNGNAIRIYSRSLADAIVPLVEQGLFPVVLGGDCSIILGPALALRRLGRYGLLFIDGHTDFYQPEADPHGEVASMELALVSGRGPAVLADIDGLCPLVRDDDIVAFGFRDEEAAAREGSRNIRDTPIRACSLSQVHSLGVARAASQALARLVWDDLDGFWIHLDADVLDDAVMPAVDYRMPGGLSLSGLSEMLGAAIRSGRAVGLTVTIFNPELDPDGRIARRFASCIADGLSGVARPEGG